ncbi:MAG: tRNA (cmo5U34)-methyltransferase, partial [Clostridia bacterium]|nr:tRNA (cmo5U34)-methyltransferase [Clostridia bacterium]
YYRIKGEHSYTQEQISAKRKSLEGVLVPITAKWNEQLLGSAGFKKIDCFYRYLNFAGWICIK